MALNIGANDVANAVGPLAAQGFGIGSNGFPGLSDRFAGKSSRNSVALYVDTEYNVSEDLLLGAAIRYEDFTDFGNTTKGKVSMRYQVSDDVAVRGAIATGFKAPTIGQSNVRNVTTAFATVNGETRLVDRATLPPTDPISIQKGATPLQPEESTSFSLGVVADFDNGLFLTVDYYNIALDDRLSTTSGIALTQADIDALTAQGVPDASSFSQVSYFTNDFSTKTKGIDVVANYALNWEGGETLLALAANWNDTEVDDVKTFTIDGDSFTNISDTRIRMLQENLPDFRWTLTANHEMGDMSYMARLNYYAGIFEDHLDAGIPIEDIGAEFTLDVEVGYQFNDDIRVAVGAKNLLDNFPDRNVDFDNEVVGSLYPTTSPIGINGGFYYMRASYTF
jgi:iron complex outermembrane receptor protein